MGIGDRIRRFLGVEDMRQEVRDIKLSIGKSEEGQQQLAQAIKHSRRTLAKPLMYSNPVGSSGLDRTNNKTFHGPMYDLAEIARVMDIEAYVNQSVRKHREQIFKEGYTISGEDDEMVDYVKRRIFEMELASGYNFEETIRDFGTSLISYATSFLVLKRDASRSSGNRIRMYGKDLEPIAAVYHMDPTSVTVKLNNLGHPVSWRQRVENSTNDKNDITYPDSDIIVATIDKKPGFVFGTPYILPVIDDVSALRKLEEIAEVVARKYAWPAVHWTVGDEKSPPEQLEDGLTEIDLVKQEVEAMTPEGGLVTSYRVNHEVISSSDGMMDLTPLIEYYEARVLGGLRLSPVDLGRGDVSKASAGASSKSLRDSSRDFQSVLEQKITYNLILPLLLEGGYDVNHQNMVKFRFPMVDSEEERANQQHGADLFNSSVISCTEFRRDFLGKKALTEEEISDTNSSIKHRQDLELAQINGEMAAKKAASTNTSSSKSSAPKKAIQNKVRPKNQYGRKPIKTSITANNNLQDYKKVYGIEVRDRLSSTLDNIRELPTDSLDDIIDPSSSVLLRSVQDGIEDALKQLGIDEDYNIPKRSVERFFRNYINKNIKSAVDGAQYSIMNNSEKDSLKESAIFEQLDDDLDYLLDRQIDIAYRFGFVRVLRWSGVDEVDFVPIEEHACEYCVHKGVSTISIAEKDMPYNYLLGTHNDCAFNLEIKMEKPGGKSNE